MVKIPGVPATGINLRIQPFAKKVIRMREFSLEELAKADGKDGRPSYIAYQGKVFEVSDSKRWKNGSHMRRHAAGADLTADLQAAPHGEEVFERFPQVGTLLPPADEVEIPALLKRLIEKVPFLERHPHPMTVHFPIVFMFSTTVFNLLYLLTGVKAFETTAFHCLGAGLLFTLVAIFTGWYAWWLVYLAKPMRPVSIKKTISLSMFGLQLAAFVWRLKVPDIMDSLHGINLLYLGLVISFFPMVTVIGWFGAHLTFPTHKK